MADSGPAPYPSSATADLGEVAARSDQRRLRNKLLQPRLQLRYGAYFFLFSAAGVVLTSLLVLHSARTVLARILSQAGGEAAALQGIIEDAVVTSVLQSAWLLPIFGIVGMAFAIAVTHRIVGPLVPIRRHIERLGRGEYEARCILRADDEFQGLADRLNELGDALRDRESGRPAPTRPPDPASRREDDVADGFSVIELLVVMLLISIVAMLAVSQLIRAFDRSRQRATLADMRSIAVAAETYHVDSSDYATALEDLEPYYTKVVPRVDRWGYAWNYSGGDSYTLTSYGNDGVTGPPPPDPWHGEPFEADLIVETGVFVQAPDSPHDSD